MEMKGVKIYLVGGAVRDELLGKESDDLDYVVVGASPELMIENGFEMVGKDFPVFLHPITKDEYALARTEEKIGAGTGGFSCDWNGVTLEEDLSRRDLTVNALAKDSSGNIIDPYNGRADLENKVLRHVSDAFKEDPVRVLRAARFMAKMPEFTVADETLVMIREMVADGAIDELTEERVWKELHRAIEAKEPVRFFETLKSFNALKKVIPILEDMIDVPQRADYHAEGDVYIHTLMVLKEATELTKDMDDEQKLIIRLGALLHDVGKTKTEDKYLYNEDGTMKGSHKNHDNEFRVHPLIDEVLDQYKADSHLKRFCKDVGVFHQRVHACKKLSDNGFHKMFTQLNLRNKADGKGDNYYLKNLLLTCKADAFGRDITLENGDIVPAKRLYPQMGIMLEKYESYKKGLKYLTEFFKEANEVGVDMKSIDIDNVKRKCSVASLSGDEDFDPKKLITRKQRFGLGKKNRSK